MKKGLFLVLAIVLAGGLSACGNSTKQKLGLVKRAPNEFMVSSRAPLSLPPEYDLRPVTGNEQIQNGNYEDKVEGLSASDKKLLSKVDAPHNNDDIKTQIDDELNSLKKND